MVPYIIFGIFALFTAVNMPYNNNNNNNIRSALCKSGPLIITNENTIYISIITIFLYAIFVDLAPYFYDVLR